MERTVKFKKCLVVIAAVFWMWAFSAESYASEKKGGTYYTCPMPEHAEVVMDKPGKCPRCGMELIKRERGTKYTCPMPEHAEVVMDKPGKCPKCGMELVPMK